MTDILQKAGSYSKLLKPNPDPGSFSYRNLSTEEIQLIETAGSVCSDWSGVRITEGTDLHLIRSCRFAGKVLIHLPSGELSDSGISDCVLYGPLEVRSSRLINGYLLMPGSVVQYCGVVSWETGEKFLSGKIQAGVETGERDIPLIPDMTHLDAAFLASEEGRELSEAASGRISDQAGSIRGIIGADASVSSCSLVMNSIFLAGARAEASGSLRDSLLMDGAAVTDGAQLHRSVLQWNSKVSSMALVTDSVVGECSTVEKQGTLTCSFLGADSVLGQGEVTASVVGPLTAMHHQSLLIAAMWPEGRGNIGYGANIGSNHTSRLPDQEIHPGAGFFFGLSTAVKFPANFSRSPFSIIATGVTTLPQRVEYPFSLILSSDDLPAGSPAGSCRLIPGWMLHSNLYSVLRNRWKYSIRTKAVHTPVETEVFTEETLEMVRTALARLESGSAQGAGGNFIKEEDRISGIQAYRKCLRTIELARKLECGTIEPAEAGEFLELAGQIREKVLSSRMKDFIRGAEIIDDYTGVRGPIEDDPFIKELLERIACIESTLQRLLGQPTPF